MSLATHVKENQPKIHYSEHLKTLDKPAEEEKPAEATKPEPKEAE